MENFDFIFKSIGYYKRAELLAAAIRLEIFKELSHSKNANEVAVKIGKDPMKTDLLLEALTSIGMIKKEGDGYKNKEVAETYFNSANDLYLGDYFLLWMDKINFCNLENLMEEALPSESQGENQSETFKKLAIVAAKEIHLKRSSYFIEAVAGLSLRNPRFKILDVGGGSGMLSIDLLKYFPNARACVFDRESVIEVPLNLAIQNKIEDRLSVRAGDFLTDNIGEGYDIVVASGILDFAAGRLSGFVQKLKNALCEGGYLYTITCGFDEKLICPWEGVINWLPRRLKGTNKIVSQKEIENVMAEQNLRLISERYIASLCQRFLEQIYIK